MDRREKNAMILTTLFITGIVISNVIAAKVVKLGVFLFPSSIVSYTFTFIIANMMSDVVGKERSKFLVFMGFLAQATASGLILLGLFLPSASIERGEAYRLLLGINWRFTLASLAAYGTSQLMNYYIFNSKFFRKASVANLASVLIAQFFDTLIFTIVAFVGVYNQLFNMVLSQYVVKIIIVLVTNPIFLLTKKLKGE
ncbi:queuosine precursor transporter [Fervidobacterium islandicum]|uniref:Probable queuosine precursor transporter n=1 Tax=Fervidobacterium islandicum TaxID=2423 RepID=A0AAI8CLS6_FERIS|nr:queuosine precursor transporter [Fervidobacterium islandicum]AMW33285.1 queuosine precursor transporter [Fervidobacterium islandicum]